MCTWRRSQVHDAIDPCHPPPRACDAVIKAMSQSLRHHRTRAIPEPATPSSSPSMQDYIIYFSLPFRPTNPDFDMLHCHITLICYITFNMSHCFDMLHCFWYATLPHCFDMLHCFCSIALLWYATLSQCFDMLHIATLLLFCYILIYMNAYYIAQSWKWAKWDECGNMDQHYCTINISASNNMKQIGHSIKQPALRAIFLSFLTKFDTHPLFQK
jgi:hypothetical protein